MESAHLCGGPSAPHDEMYNTVVVDARLVKNAAGGEKAVVAEKSNNNH